MKKLLAVLLFVISTSAFAGNEPCWGQVNGRVLDSNKITSMYVTNQDVFGKESTYVVIILNKDVVQIRVANAQAGHDMIQQILKVNRKCHL
jgi:hypothetical protein